MTAAPFDRALLGRRRRRALAAAGLGADFLLAHAASDLIERLAPVLRRFDTVLDLGGLTERTRAALLASGKAGRVIRGDSLVSSPLGAGADLVLDEEALPFASGSLDAVVSLLGLHLVNDLPGVLVQIRRALRGDGLFLAALLGGETLRELRHVLVRAESELFGGAGPRVAPFADLRDLGGLMQRAGFALPVADLERTTVRYGSVMALLRDLRAMGGANPLAARARRPLTRALLDRVNELYAANFADADGRLRATFDIVWLSGWAPHESQPKPLKPGSAQVPLAEALAAIGRDRRSD